MAKINIQNLLESLGITNLELKTDEDVRKFKEELDRLLQEEDDKELSPAEKWFRDSEQAKNIEEDGDEEEF